MNKFHARRVKYDGITFDSKKEYERYLVLKALETKGKIGDLLVHVPYTLFPKSQYGREIKYVADFVYFDGKETIVEDVKGCKYGSAYQIFKLKKRIMQEKYGITILET